MSKPEETPVTPSAGSDNDPYRLPKTVIPHHYFETITPDIANKTFTNEVVTDIEVTEPVPAVTLNAKELQIDEAFVTNDSGTRLNATVSMDPSLERTTFTFAGMLGKGMWKQHVSQTGILNNKLRGLYPSRYKNAAGIEQTDLITQFEATDARRTKACADEPIFKATHQVRLVVDEDIVAFSNTPIASEEIIDDGVRYLRPGTTVVNFQGKPHVQQITQETDAEGVVRQHITLVPVKRKKMVTFKPTIKLSSYLLAYGCGKNLVRTDPVRVRGMDLTIICRPEQKQLTELAMRVAAFGIDFYSDWFDVQLPLELMQFKPVDEFEAGAMENFGLITHRAKDLLINLKTASLAQILRVIEVILHELAHQWNGDLVTMAWWDGLGLNEYFATLMSYISMEAFLKVFMSDLNIWDKFCIARELALELSALKTVQPIEADVRTAEQAEGRFTPTTYEGGASNMEQWRRFMGADKFREAVRNFIKKHLLGNAQTHELWEEIGVVSGLPVQHIQETWVRKPGVPLVTASPSSNANCVTLTQQSFKYLQENVEHEQLWPIPLSIRAKTPDGEKSFQALMTERQQDFFLGEGWSEVWLNAGGHDYYRHRYAPELLKKLVVAKLAVSERFSLVADTLACMRAGLTSASDYLHLLKSFVNEDDPSVWQKISDSLTLLRGLLPADGRGSFEGFVRDLVQTKFAELGWSPTPGETPQRRQLRGLLITMMGGILGNDTTVQSKARELFAQYKADNSAVDAEVVPALVAIVAATGGQAEYEEFFRFFQTAPTPQDRLRFLNALASFSDPDLLQRTLQTALDEKQIPTQDAPTLVKLAMDNNPATVWQFIKDNWETITKLYPDKGIVALCGGITSLSTPELEADTQAFFASHKVKTGEETVPQFLELQHVAVLLKQREAASVAAFFSKSE